MTRGGKARWTTMINFRGTDDMEHWLKETAKKKRTSYSSLLRSMVIHAMNEEVKN